MPSTSPRPDNARRAHLVALGVLGFLLAERVLLALAHPDLIHDLDPGELRHLDLAISGLPDGPSLAERLYTWLSGTENIHHGGFPLLSVAFLLASQIFGHSLLVLRLLGPILATVVAAGCVAKVLMRRLGPSASLLMLALFAGAPPLLLKWTCTARGGHLEAIALPALMLLLLDYAVTNKDRRLWLLAGLTGGLSVYVTYLAVPAVLVLSAGALLEAHRGQRATGALLETHRGLGLPSTLGSLALGGVVGFSPWILGLLVLDLPYLEATIHSSANPNEANEVHGRTMLSTLSMGLSALPHNLWPWTITQANAAAYLAAEPDILDYSPGLREWASRAVINLAALAGIIFALRKKAFLIAAFLLLPALHHLFVLRAANQPGWPLIPHRYLVLVFPAVVAGAAYGAACMLHDARKGLARLGAVLGAALLLIAVAGVNSHLPWLEFPSLKGNTEYRADLYRKANIGQVRLSEAAAIAKLADPEDSTWLQERWQGLARVYRPIADYYLLFREDPNQRPYPSQMFSDQLSQGGEQAPIEAEQLRVQVRTALAATVLRAGADEQQRDRWICSWQPSVDFEAAVRQVLQQQLPQLACPQDSALGRLQAAGATRTPRLRQARNPGDAILMLLHTDDPDDRDLTLLKTGEGPSAKLILLEAGEAGEAPTQQQLESPQESEVAE